MIKLTLPLSDETIASLKAGDVVSLSGKILTGRDAAHKRLIEALNKHEALPVPLKDQAIYYVGPCPAPAGRPIGSCGPTTSGRMDAYAPTLIDLGLRIMIGKGMRAQPVKDAIVRTKGLYFIAVGGAGALIADCVKDSRLLAYGDLLSEAAYELTVEDMPLIVGVDSYGNDIYIEGQKQWKRI